MRDLSNPQGVLGMHDVLNKPHNNHTASTILVEKFRQLRRGFTFFQLASVLWVLLMAMIGWEGLR